MEEDCNGSYHEPNIEDDYSVDSLVMTWDKMRQLATIKMICLVIYGLYITQKRLIHNHMPSREETIAREIARRNLFTFYTTFRRSRHFYVCY